METASAHQQQLYPHYCKTEDMSAGVARTVVIAIAAVLGTSIALMHCLLHLRRKLGGSHLYIDPLPPGPRPLPIVGSLPLLGKSPHVSLARLATKYGPLMTVRLGTTTFVIASSADMAKQFLRSYDKVFSQRPHTLASTILAFNHKALTFSDGSLWLHLRKICLLELFTPKRLEAFRAARTEELDSMTTAIFEESRQGKPVNLNFKLWCLGANHMTRMLMSKRYFGSELEGSQEAKRFKLLVDNILYWFGLFLIGDFSPAFRWVDKLQGVHNSMRKVSLERDSFLMQLVNERTQPIKAAREGSTTHREAATMDFIDVLLSMPSENGEGHLPKSTILAVIQDMLIAGTETSAISVEWAMAELLRHPVVMSRLQSEIDTVVGITRLVEESDIPNLKYLQAVVKENFRLHPPGPLLAPHESSEACQIAGYYIPPKTRLLVNVWAIGRDAKSWEKPLIFDPDRFMDHYPERDVKGQTFELLPFGSGRRGCVGVSLGLLIVQTTLARLVHSFDWSLPDGQHPNMTLDMSERFKASLTMKYPLHALIAKPRLAAHLYS